MSFTRDSRAYGTAHFKDVGVLLLPWETPRKAYTMPVDDTCPHCGRKGDRRLHWFHCRTCGTVLQEDPPEVMPMQESFKQEKWGRGREMVQDTCTRCGSTFEKLPTTKRTMCRRCANIVSGQEWRKEQMALKKAMSKSNTKEVSTVGNL